MSIRMSLSPELSTKAKWAAFVIVLVSAVASFAACSGASDEPGATTSDLGENLNGRDRMPLATYLK